MFSKRPFLVRISLTLLIAGMLTSLTLIPTAAVSQNLTFTPIADSYVDSSSPSTNYGTSTTLRVDGSPIVNSYLRFVVSGLNGQAIVQAELLIHANSSTSQSLVARSVQDETWGETTLNYSNAPPMGATLATSSAVVSGTWVTLNVSAYVTEEGTYSFGVSTPGSTAISLSTRESGANAPQLVVTVNGLSTPVGTNSQTQTPTNQFTPTGTAFITQTPTTQFTSTGTAVLTQTPTTQLTPTVTAFITQTPTTQFTPTGTAFITQTPTIQYTSTVTAVITNTPTLVSTSTGVSSTSAIKHVFVVVMENHSYAEVWNKSTTPYITSLGNAYAFASDYFATAHPSLPNYLELYGGSNYGITTDCSPSATCHVNATNLADNLNAKGLTWKGYMESMPSNCGLTTSGKYAPKHDPFVYFDDIRNSTARCDAGVVPYTALANDLNSASTTPNYVFITPNLCDDMHDCSVSTGDTWLKNNLPAILNSPACTVDKCLLALTWDEDDGSQSNHVLTIFAGSGAKTGGVVSTKAYNHYSLLRTVEWIFGLPTQTSRDATASPMTDLLR
jgi:acid phosphatase